MTGNITAVRLKQRHLEKRLAKERRLPLDRPKDGWIQSIRESLGIRASQLARKMGVTKQTIRLIENSDRKGTITLTTLQRVAEALGCHVKVVLLPDRPLNELLRDQSLKQAKKIVDRTNLHMSLEKQGTDEDYREQQIQEMAEELVRKLDRRLWEDVELRGSRGFKEDSQRHVPSHLEMGRTVPKVE